MHPLDVLPETSGIICRNAEHSVLAGVNKYTKHLGTFNIKKCQVLRKKKKTTTDLSHLQTLGGPFDLSVASTNFISTKMGGNEDNGQKGKGQRVHVSKPLTKPISKAM